MTTSAFRIGEVVTRQGNGGPKTAVTLKLVDLIRITGPHFRERREREQAPGEPAINGVTTSAFRIGEVVTRQGNGGPETAVTLKLVDLIRIELTTSALRMR